MMKKNNSALIIFLMTICVFLAGFSSCEEKAFKRAEKQNTITAYEQFLKKYPNGKFSWMAAQRIEWFSLEQAQDKNTIEAYEDYLRRFPEGNFRAMAIKELDFLVGVEVKKLTVEQMAQMRGLIKTDFGEIEIKFFPQKAPETCRNFIKLAKSHFYDGTQFHIVMADYLIQGGSPGGDPNGGPGYMIKAEFNDLPNVPGAVGMARGSHPDSAGSQFYICLAHIPERDRQYTVFAMVEKGLEVATEISHQNAPGPEAGADAYKPFKPVYIKTIEIR